MQTLGRVLAVIGRAFAWAWAAWIRDISGRKSAAGKAASIGIGLLVICCGLSAVTAAVRGAGERVGLVPTRTATATRAPTARPTIVEVDPTDTPAPTATVAPSEAPAPTVTRAVTRTADATIVDPGDFQDDQSRTIGAVCPGDTVAFLEHGVFWDRVQIVTVGPDCKARHVGPGAEGWVARHNIRGPTATPRPSRTPRPTEPPTATREATATRAAEPTRTAVPTRPAAPAPTKAPTTKREGVPGSGGYDCPADYPVKGNQSGIYHTPASRYYSRTKPEWCFATAADAAAAGFRPPKQ